MKIPPSHQAVMPYLVLKNAESFFAFVTAVFNAKDLGRHYDDEKRLIHGEVQIGNSTIMLGESNEQWPAQPAGMFIYVNNADNTYALALQYGAKTLMEPATKDYGRTCGVEDPFGNTWWITSL